MEPEFSFVPDKTEFEAFLDLRLKSVGLDFRMIEPFYPEAIRQCARTHALTRSRYYRDGAKRPLFITAHYSQVTLLLYRLARLAFLADETTIANRLYFLNVSQSSCDLFHEVELPIRTSCDHPLGAVIGRGHFSDTATLVFADGCAIGNNWGHYPVIEGRLIMTSRASLIGKTTIRGTVVMARGATLVDAGVVEDCLVVGSGLTMARKPLDPEKLRILDPFEA